MHMSTLCRAGQECQGNKTERVVAFHSPDEFFCPTHLSAFQKGVNGCRKISDNRKYFGNISEKQPFSEKISDLFFLETLYPVSLSQTASSLPSLVSFMSLQVVKS